MFLEFEGEDAFHRKVRSRIRGLGVTGTFLQALQISGTYSPKVQQTSAGVPNGFRAHFFPNAQQVWSPLKGVAKFFSE